MYWVLNLVKFRSRAQVQDRGLRHKWQRSSPHNLIQTLCSARAARKVGSQRDCGAHAGRRQPTCQGLRQEYAGEISALVRSLPTPRLSAYKTLQF